MRCASLCGARLLGAVQSAPEYKFYALAGGPVQRPGMVRVNEGGAAIDMEVWELPAEHFGSFVDGIPAPLGIGKVKLADGSWVSGFVCEAVGVEGGPRSLNWEAGGLGWRSRAEFRCLLLVRVTTKQRERAIVASLSEGSCPRTGGGALDPSELSAITQ